MGEPPEESLARRRGDSLGDLSYKGIEKILDAGRGQWQRFDALSASLPAETIVTHFRRQAVWRIRKGVDIALAIDFGREAYEIAHASAETVEENDKREAIAPLKPGGRDQDVGKRSTVMCFRIHGYHLLHNVALRPAGYSPAHLGGRVEGRRALGDEVQATPPGIGSGILVDLERPVEETVRRPGVGHEFVFDARFG